MTGYMETSILTSLNMERKDMTTKKKSAEDKIVNHMMDTYPTVMTGVKNHMNESFRLFAKKQMDYGLGNIAMNGNKELALLGILIRLNDKVQRGLNILMNNQEPNNESLEDTGFDITNYGAIFNTVLKDEWKK